MGKIFAGAAFCALFVVSAYSADTLNDKNENGRDHDGYYMRDGKMFMTRDGNSTVITTESTLTDGSRLSADGTFVSRDGTRTQLSNNQGIGMDGKRFESREQITTRPDSHNQTAPTSSSNTTGAGGTDQTSGRGPNSPSTNNAGSANTR